MLASIHALSEDQILKLIRDSKPTAANVDRVSAEFLTLYLDDITIPLSDSVKSLGVLLDSILSMEKFINKTSKFCCYNQFRWTNSVWSYPSTEATVKLVTALILSRLTTAILSFLVCLLPLSTAFVTFRTVRTPHPEEKKTKK